MAKTTREKGGKQQPTGPVLVDEAPPMPAVEELLPPVEDDSEEIEDSSVEAASPDPRRVPAVADNMPGQQLWAFLAQYPDPQYLDLYGYRLFPVIKATAPPEWTGTGKAPTYQEKVKGLITEQTNRIVDYNWLRDVRGSGTYFIRIIDRRLKRTQNRQICTSKIEVNEWDTHPPVLNDWTELVPCEANKWIINRLLKDRIIKRNSEGGFMAYQDGQQNQNGTATLDPGALLDKTVNLAQKLAQTMQPKESASAFSGKDIVDLIKEQTKQNDPQKVIDAAKGLVEISRPLATPPPPPPDNTLVTLLLAQLKEQSAEAAAARAREFELMKEMMKQSNAPAPAPPDPVATIEAQAKAYVTLREAFGGGDAAAAQSRMNGWQEFLKEPLTGFIGLLQPFAQVGAALLAARAQQAQQANAPAQPKPATATAPPTSSAVTQGQQPPAPAAPGQPQQQPAAATQETEPPMPPAPNPVLIVLNAALMHVDFTLRDYFANELPGSDFAAWFCDTAIPLPAPYNLMQESVIGAEALKKLQQFTATDPQGKTLDAPEAGKNLLIAAYKANPAIWAKIVTSPDKEPKFSKFLDEFLAYNPEGEPAPVAAAKGAKRP